MDYEAIFDSLPLPTLLLLPDAPDFLIVGANQAYLQATGRSESTVINRPLFEAFPEDPKNKDGNGVSNLRASLMQVVKNKVPHKMAVQKYNIQNEDGEFETRYWDPQNIPVFDKGGKVVNILHTVSDVTNVVLSQREKSKIKSDLTLKNEQYASLFNHNPDAVFALDLEGHFVSTNAQLRRLVGKEEKDLLKLTFEPFIAPEDLPRVKEYFRKAAEGSAQNYDTSVVTAHGDRRIVNATKLPIVVNDTVVGVFGIAKDITKQEEEHQIRRLFEKVINEANDVIVILDAKKLEEESGSTILFVNAAFSAMTGYSFEEVVGQSPRMLLAPKTDPQVVDRMIADMRNFNHCDVDLLYHTKKKEEIWVNVSISPVTDRSGVVTHFVSVQKDITQRKQQELQKELLADIYQIFSHQASLSEILQKVLKKVVDYGDFHLAEAWLMDASLEKLTLFSSFAADQEVKGFLSATKDVRQLHKGQGLPGKVWETGKSLLWNDIDSLPAFIRNEAAGTAGLKSAYGIPLIFHEKVIGVLVLSAKHNTSNEVSFAPFFETFGPHFGAEIKRKQIEQDLTRVFDVAADIICLASFDGYFKKINPAMSRLLEYTENELLKTPIVNFTHPDDLLNTTEELQRLVKGNNTQSFENRYMTKSGKVIWLAWTATSVVEEQLIYGVARDVTERKQLEELLNKANNLARIGSWEIDMEKNTLYWSSITKEIHEVDPDFVPNIEAGIHFYREGESREYISRAVNEAIKNGTPWDMELQLVTAKRNIRWVRAIGEAEFINGKCVRIYGSFQDIHQRKEMEIGLNRALREKNTILESIGDGFFTVDKEWIVTYWNKAAEEMLHLPKEAIIGKFLWNLFPDHVNAPSFINYQRALTENTAVHFEDYVEPIDKWFEISAYPSAAGLTGYFRDVTDRKRTEAQLSELNQTLRKHAEELAASNAELEQFAYVASHDLQEPLRMITGFLTQLEKKYASQLDDKARTYIGFATDGAKRMRQIILDLLEFSRVGRAYAIVEKVDINQLLAGVHDVFAKKLELMGGTLRWEPMPVVETMKTPLSQVFQNLISNSLKYAQSGIPLVVEIEASEKESFWEISVKDNGIGIDPEYAEKIFVIFQRLHNHSEYSGTGMGLSICKKIIETIGGKIWVESKEGMGSRFIFTLPKR